VRVAGPAIAHPVREPFSLRDYAILFLSADHGARASFRFGSWLDMQDPE
jgi:hypothetical protein